VPASLIRSFANRYNKSTEEVEKLWTKAKFIAKDSDMEDNYKYAVGILKRMLKLETLTFKEFVITSKLDKV
jgi:hypothetical protein